jgi:hypothetical protein
MIKACLRYLQQEAAPRWRGIIFTADFVLSVAVGYAVGTWGHHVLPESTKVSDVGIALLTYAAIALGFCLAGLTLVLTLPHENFVKRLVSVRSRTKDHDSYSDLLFVFSWTALLHWAILFISIVVLLLWGAQQPILSPYSSLRHRIFVGIVSGLTVYCLFQFLITLITLSQVGRVYIKSIREGK